MRHYRNIGRFLVIEEGEMYELRDLSDYHLVIQETEEGKEDRVLKNITRLIKTRREK